MGRFTAFVPECAGLRLPGAHDLQAAPCRTRFVSLTGESTEETR